MASGSCENEHDECCFDIAEGLERVPVFFDGGRCIKKWKKFKYITCNIPGPGSKVEDFEAMLAGCSCTHENTCNPDCLCIKNSCGPSYDCAGKLLSSDLHPAFPYTKPVLECGQNCSCPQSCHNRVSQYGLSCSVDVFPTPHKGLGLRSLQPIPHLTFVCEYAGEILDYPEAKRRTQLLAENDMNYILVLQEHCGQDKLIRMHVDPTHLGNVGRFINHSCEPNLFMTPVRVSSSIPKLCLFATRDISSGEELTFNYSGSNPKASDFKDHRKNTSEKQKLCFCGTNKCNGSLPFDSSLF